MEIGEQLGIRLFNAPYGHRRPGESIEMQDEIAAGSIAFAMKAARHLGGTILLMEPLSGMPRYPRKKAGWTTRVS
ncbi:hypothetical protein [Nonomuraea rhodomycinica]|uniref:Uncharacterized protein n=1 Tax=Nonomuraea rhodomycinica TaxID=1712872 RepID=A0A7Y6IMD1_9ACTN|nr:hypothetical protein [Nonomuraea rhodomycinica]NUW39564.1 hypothetical protein [Nonomuraea rhodomycinica]